MDPSGRLISREDLVLVLVDYQEKLAGVMEERASVLSAASRLARVTAMVGAPIIVTRQNPEKLGPTEPILQQALLRLAETGARVHEVDKMAFSCSTDPGFRETLAANGRRHVVVCGMETHICVAQTSLALAEDGYRVQVAADACCSRSRYEHEMALARMRAEGVSVSTCEAVMYETVGQAGTDEFRALLSIVKGE